MCPKLSCRSFSAGAVNYSCTTYSDLIRRQIRQQNKIFRIGCCERNFRELWMPKITIGRRSRDSVILHSFPIRHGRHYLQNIKRHYTNSCRIYGKMKFLRTLPTIKLGKEMELFTSGNEANCN